MDIMSSLKNFLYDKKFNIIFFDNNVYMYNYVNLKSLNNDLISLDFDKFILNIKGHNFIVKKLMKNEILINGTVSNVEFIYEK